MTHTTAGRYTAKTHLCVHTRTTRPTESRYHYETHTANIYWIDLPWHALTLDPKNPLQDSPKWLEALAVRFGVMLQGSWVRLPKTVDVKDRNEIFEVVVASKGACLPDTAFSRFTVTHHTIYTIAVIEQRHNISSSSILYAPPPHPPPPSLKKRMPCIFGSNKSVLLSSICLQMLHWSTRNSDAIRN